MFKKKLKRISQDVIGYVKVKGMNARDADELTMIVSYGYSKLERCEWYMNIIQSGDSKYVVPQSLDELKYIRDTLRKTLDEVTQKPLFRGKGTIYNRNGEF